MTDDSQTEAIGHIEGPAERELMGAVEQSPDQRPEFLVEACDGAERPSWRSGTFICRT